MGRAGQQQKGPHTQDPPKTSLSSCAALTTVTLLWQSFKGREWGLQATGPSSLLHHMLRGALFQNLAAGQGHAPGEGRMIQGSQDSLAHKSSSDQPALHSFRSSKVLSVLDRIIPPAPPEKGKTTSVPGMQRGLCSWD